jgi:hypothetical protein
MAISEEDNRLRRFQKTGLRMFGPKKVEVRKLEKIS